MHIPETLQNQNVVSGNVPVLSTETLAVNHVLRCAKLTKKRERLRAKGSFGAEVVAGELELAIECHKQAAMAGFAGNRKLLFKKARWAVSYEDSAQWCKRMNAGLAV